MKTKTGVSLSQKAIELLAKMSERLGLSRSALLEMIVRYYAEEHGYELDYDKNV